MILHMFNFRNMLFSVGGDLGDVYYTGGVNTEDLEGRQLLSTGTVTFLNVNGEGFHSISINSHSCICLSIYLFICLFVCLFVRFGNLVRSILL